MSDRCPTSVDILIDAVQRTAIVEIIIQIEMDSREMITSDENSVSGERDHCPWIVRGS